MTQALDQTTLESFLVHVYPAERSSVTDLDTGSALGFSALVREHEMATDTGALHVQVMDDIHKATPDVG